MNEETRDLFFDLLTKKATSGLDEAEETQLDQIKEAGSDDEFISLEIAASAITLAGTAVDEPLPSNLYSKIAEDALQYIGKSDPVAEATAADDSPWPSAPSSIFTADEVFAEPKSSWFGWLGWVAAAAACVALALNIWLTRTNPAEVANVKPPIQAPAILTPAEARDAMLASASTMVKASWAPGNVKEIKEVTGDVVWSDERQAGYMRFRGLPANDPSKETYQLWIFDKTQDKATPIDGGTFDVRSDGEVVIPINAKLKAKEPEMFAITMEKPGGVVVSKREKLAAVAKVETHNG